MRALAAASSGDETDAAHLYELTTGPTRVALIGLLINGIGRTARSGSDPSAGESRRG